MIIKELDKQTVDVFVDNGWNNWSRFNVSGKFPKLVKGASLSEEDYKELLKNYVKNVRKVRA